MRSLLLLLLLHYGFWAMAQHQDKVNFKQAEVSIRPMPQGKEVSGTVVYRFDVLENLDSVFLDAKNMKFISVLLNNRKANFANDGKIITIKKKFKKGKRYQLELTYFTQPKQTVYFLGWQDDVEGNEQIWTQGQGKYTSHWIPSFDDMTEKVEFDLSITFDMNYEVIANGKLIGTQAKENLKTWNFDMQKPMSCYLLAFAIGKYDQQSLTSSSGIPIQNYYYPKDSLRVEPTYRYTKKIFDFLELEIGVPYPWQNYKQVPLRDFLYAGMENTGTTFFSDGYVIDSIAFLDKSYVNINAHEMAHQWFGDLVTEKNGNHHWLHEGFATYYALLAEKEIFGDEHFYWKLFDSAKQLNNLSEDEMGEALTDPNASSPTFYEKGAWALYMLRNKVGDEAFKRGIKSYLEKYGFENVTIDDFLAEVARASTLDLSGFKELWLNGTEFPYEKCKENMVLHSKPISDYLKLKWALTTSLNENESIIQSIWDATKSVELKKRIIAKYYKSLSPEFLHKAFETHNLEIRQALATIDGDYPVLLKKDYESLLEDGSYVTVENALYRLWVNFPGDRVAYLNRTKGIIGLPNKNVRQLWLLLAILTKDYQDDSTKKEYMSELMGYTSPYYSHEVRQLAFELIHEVFEFSDQNLKDLINASVHHSWQFKKYARTLLDALMQDDRQRKRIIRLSSKGLNETEMHYINSKIRTK